MQSMSGVWRQDRIELLFTYVNARLTARMIMELVGGCHPCRTTAFASINGQLLDQEQTTYGVMRRITVKEKAQPKAEAGLVVQCQVDAKSGEECAHRCGAQRL